MSVLPVAFMLAASYLAIARFRSAADSSNRADVMALVIARHSVTGTSTMRPCP